MAAEQAKALARGKRAKLRRAKEKYRDQDEEDRALALEVLAPAGELLAACMPVHPAPLARMLLMLPQPMTQNAKGTQGGINRAVI